MKDSIRPRYTPLKFRDLLLRRIESRREIAHTFKTEDVYFFIQDCRKAYGSAGTPEAQEALRAINENGSFRLVADSRSEFLAILRDEVVLEKAQPRQAGLQ